MSSLDPRVGRATDEEPAAAADDPNREFRFFPGSELFRPLIADPRWPRFSGAFQQYLDEDELDRVGSANFGDHLPILRSPDYAWGHWETAIQAGVFSVFDLDAASFDLVNSDFLAGLTATHRYETLTTMIRIYHQSSHLGDEFVLRDRADRVNLSYEVLDLITSFKPWTWLRLYAGGGLLVHREPNLDRGLVQSGVELASPITLARGTLRPILAVDLQNRQESDWNADVSVRTGFQVEHPALENRRLHILGEFYSGRSPNGQFYEHEITTLGVGLYFSL